MVSGNQAHTLKFEMEKDPDFKTVHIDGAIVTLNPNFGQLALVYDEPEFKINPNGEIYTEKIQKRILIDARMSPESFRSLAITMMQHVKQYDEWRRQRELDRSK